MVVKKLDPNAQELESCLKKPPKNGSMPNLYVIYNVAINGNGLIHTVERTTEIKSQITIALKQLEQKTRADT